jgi:hypothetical protein
MQNYKKSILEMQFNFDFLPIKVHPGINFGLENLLIWAYLRTTGKLDAAASTFLPWHIQNPITPKFDEKGCYFKIIFQIN